MKAITNNTGVSLAMAVWAVNDDYDYSKIENYISATSLMKPLRQVVLRARIDWSQQEPEDVTDHLSRALGSSIHDSIEKAWVKNGKVNLAKLGYPKTVIDRILINPTDEELDAHPNPIPIYVEQRAIKTLLVNGKFWNIGGKFDMVSEGIVQDFKTTSAFTWVYGGRDEEHQLQGSIYQWLNPDKIREDFIRINYLFTDWQKYMARQNPAYPQHRVEFKDIPLLGIDATEAWLVDKLNKVMHFWNAREQDIPFCTDEELWMSEPVHKFYAKPETAQAGGRCTKKFDDLAAARAHMASKGGTGIIITDRGEPKRCDYCDVFSQCSQKDTFEKYQS